jgi:methionyl-tRNA formyltransferase
MRIVILAMDDPLYTNDFIKKILKERKEDIVLYAYVTKGNRMTIGKDRSKVEYLISLFFIMGPFQFAKNTLKTIWHKIRKRLSNYGLVQDPTVYGFAKNNGINVKKIQNPNSKKFCEYLAKLKPDIIINQSQTIIKKRLLSIPEIGIINRHNALLPKNRGRLTPFWVMYKKEQETGVSIHFVEEGIDSGDIIVQKKFTVSPKDNFNTIVKKNYAIAGKAMLEAIEKLENGFTDYIKNDDNKASYNTIPTLKQAIEYRMSRMCRK